MRFLPKILIVESDEETQLRLQEGLEQAHLAYICVTSTAQAQQALLQHQFDLFVVSQQLPPQGGLAYLTHLKQMYPETDALWLTDTVATETLLSALRLGIYDCLQKPLQSMPDVIGKIQQALQKRRMMLEHQHMIRYLTEANSQIEEMNRDLEAQVVLRTRQLQEANNRLEQLTLTDDVTGLYNQRFLHVRLDEEFHRARRYGEGFSVMMLDVDFFKQVNDSHDHLYGSRVLRRVGEIIRALVRDTDMVVRYGGDEFCVLLPHARQEEGLKVAQRLCAHMRGVNVGDEDDPWHATLSIGVAGMDCCPVTTSRELLRAADQALYDAKAAGRNQAVAVEPNNHKKSAAVA